MRATVQKPVSLQKSERRSSITSKIILRRRVARNRNRNVVVSEDSDFLSYDSEVSEYEDVGDESSLLTTDIETSTLAVGANKILLLLPVAITVIFRSISSPDFRAIAIAWAVILPFTSDISMDEGVFPALIASSLGFDNSVVARNMYISIARSRLGLFALAMLSYYSSNYQIIICGVMLKLLVTASASILQNSIPVSEVTLICGGIVNVIFHLVNSPLGDIYEPAALIACGLGGAVICYPLLVRFVNTYRKTKGNSSQLALVWTIYLCYFSSAGYFYFWVYGANFLDILGAARLNADIIVKWGSILAAALTIAYFFGSRLGLDGRRKLWHLTSVLLFLPEHVRKSPFTKTSLAVAIVLFIALETARATALPPFGAPLHNALKSFVDHRDQRGPVIISHIYLLLGISVPIFLAGSPAGVVCLGIGDTFASQVGRRFGRVRIFGHKSFEGCLAFILASSVMLHYFTTIHHIWAITIPTALLEAVTPLNDNLIVPIYMLALQGLLNSK